MIGSNEAVTYYNKEQLGIFPIAYRTVLKHSKIKDILMALNKWFQRSKPQDTIESHMRGH